MATSKVKGHFRVKGSLQINEGHLNVKGTQFHVVDRRAAVNSFFLTEVHVASASTTAAAAQKTIVQCQGCRALDTAGMH